MSNGTMFGDLDWPLNASRRFVSISWTSCGPIRTLLPPPRKLCFHFVCESLRSLAVLRENYSTDLKKKNWWQGGTWPTEETIIFWWQSGSDPYPKNYGNFTTVGHVRHGVGGGRGLLLTNSNYARDCRELPASD